jgi:hypothetical protein
MSRTIHRAPLAVGSDGTMFHNVLEFGAPRDLERVVARARRIRGAVFVGVVLSRHETARVLGEFDRLAFNLTGKLVASRMHRVTAPFSRPESSRHGVDGARQRKKGGGSGRCAAPGPGGRDR